MMQTKLSQVKAAYEAKNFKKAIQIAAKFYDLGNHRAAILDAHLAITNPRWAMQLNKNLDETIDAGIKALAIRYNF
jgi:hypothetical protein